MKRIVISGYYGFGNTGDEAVLSGICAALTEAGADAEITVISADPARTVREHPGVRAVRRSDLWRQQLAMFKADLFISGGGSLFQDATSVRSPYYYLAILNLARALQCKTMIYAQGVGPLIRPAIRKAVAKAFDRASAITVRDADSKALLRELGVTREVQVTADPSFLVEPDLAAADAIISEAGLAGRPLVGVSLRPWPGHEQWLYSAARAIEGVCEELGATVAYIPMQESEDAAIVGEGIVLRHGGDPAVAKGLVARCELVVGMRLHSLIFAVGSGVPFVPIAYDPKVTSFATDAGGLDGIDVGADLHALGAVLRDAWARREQAADGMSRKSAELKELASECGKLVSALLR